jgi:hypothetical protein
VPAQATHLGGDAQAARALGDRFVAAEEDHAVTPLLQPQEQPGQVPLGAAEDAGAVVRDEREWGQDAVSESTTGRSKENVVPSPGSLFTSSVEPCASTRPRAIESPSPAPARPVARTW